MFISGGGNDGEPPDKADRMMAQIAKGSKSVVTELKMVPNQPLVFDGETHGRKEDSLIAYTWDKFLRTGDAKWPARLPMTKSAVRAMDTVTVVLRQRRRRQAEGRQVRRLRRLEARLDHLDHGGRRQARRGHRAVRDRHAEHRAVVRAPLGSLWLLGPGRGRLRAA